MRHDDGSLGWDRYAPYDAILVAAAAAGIPSALTDQLAIGGRLVIPVGPSGDQKLMLVTKTASGLEEQILELVSFVPMVGGVT